MLADSNEKCSNTARWQVHLRNYILGIANTFRSELRRVTNQHGGDVQLRENFTLRKIEVAWEFAAEEPTELVRSLAPHLRRYRDLESRTRHHRSTPEDGVEVNALSVILRVRADVSIRLYAKTNRRVRFEVIYKNINHRELLGELPMPRGERSARAPRSWDDLFRCLNALRTRAADELNGVLEFLTERTRIVPSHTSAFSFLIAVASIMKDRALAHALVLFLLEHDGIVARRAGEPLLNACRTLVAEGIFSYDWRRRVFDVTDRYRHAKAMLRAYSPGSLLTTARERRRSVPRP